MSSAAPQIEWLDTVDSTNDAIRRRFVDDEARFAQFHTVATTNQTAGRGRLDRQWVDTPGASLAMSTYVEFAAEVARTAIGWVSLSAGLALRDALAGLAREEHAQRLQLKWPNDVLIDGRKTAGILGEVLGVLDGGERFACVVGCGVNLREPEPMTAPISIVAPPAAAGAALASAQVSEMMHQADALANAAAIAELGITAAPGPIAQAYLDAFAARIGALVAHGGDARASGLAAELEARLTTLGQRVRVSLIGGSELHGTATGLAATGELLIAGDDGAEHAVRVGDVHHLRPAEARA